MYSCMEKQAIDPHPFTKENPLETVMLNEYTFIFYGMIVNTYLIEICGVSHYMYYYHKLFLQTGLSEGYISDGFGHGQKDSNISNTFVEYQKSRVEVF